MFNEYEIFLYIDISLRISLIKSKFGNIGEERGYFV